jgi:hypothetical protein
MNFVTLKTNPPEKVAAIIGRKGSVFGYGYSYHIVDFCPIESSVDNVINELQSHSMTQWKFAEDKDNE